MVLLNRIANSFRAALAWRDLLSRDILLTLLEAILVLAISQIPFYLLAVKYTTETSGVSFSIETVALVVGNNVRPGEVLIYIAGILASTTVYFIMRARHFRNRLPTLAIAIVGPITLILVATPTFMADRYDRARNVEFMSDYALVLLISALLLWLYSLLAQRRIENVTIFSSAEAARKIIDKVRSEEA